MASAGGQEVVLKYFSVSCMQHLDPPRKNSSDKTFFFFFFFVIESGGGRGNLTGER
jgi:hypothetical protein